MVEVKLFSGTNSLYLSEKIADYYGYSLGKHKLLKFSDGEMQPIIMESVRGAYVFFIQSTFIIPIRLFYSLSQHERKFSRCVIDKDL